ncbi:MAG: 2-methylcitrate dehydratase [Alphaproteobacteria bacterium]|nr:2-methylcitrate dehydratase [Alphaproteobacteria bacterium]
MPPDKPDKILAEIADYVLQDDIIGDQTVRVAHLAFMDFLGCAFAALDERDCQRLIRPLVPGLTVPGGARVPGTRYELDPASAAFGFSALGRWLDYNDSWFGKGGGGHPSDMFGALLAMGDYLSRNSGGARALTMNDVLVAGVKAYEIMGLHLQMNEFGGFDFTGPLKAACAAVLTRMLGGGFDDIIAAVSQGWVDGQPLRIVRSPRTGPRKNWASADAASRAVWLAMKTMEGESGYPEVLTTPGTGLYDAERNGEAFEFSNRFGSFVMDTIQFKVYPAQFRTQTALEAAIALYPLIRDRLEDIERVEIETHERTIHTVDKTGELDGPADRDHCLQYIVAIGLIFGALRYVHYSDAIAADPRVDALRDRMLVRENPDYTRGYQDKTIKTDANALQVFFTDGTSTERVEVLYPMGDPVRRQEVLPVLARKFRENLAGRLSDAKTAALVSLYDDFETFSAMPVDRFVDLTIPDNAA